MTTPELLDFIKSQIASGVSRERITQMLVSNGWKLIDINEGFTEVVGAPASVLPTTASPAISNPLSVKPVQTLTSPVSASPVSSVRPAVFGQINPVASVAAAQPVTPVGTYQASPKEEPLIVVTDALPTQTPVASPVATPKRKLPWIILIIVVVLAVLVGAAYAYTTYFAESPEKVVKQAFLNFAQAETFTYSGTLSFETTGGPSLDTLLPLGADTSEASEDPEAVLEEQVDTRVSETTKADVRLSGVVDVKNNNMELAVLDTAGQFSFESKSVNGSFYIKPDIALLPIEDTWISLQGGDEATPLEIPVLDETRKTEIRAALSSDTLFTVTEEFPDETVNNQKMHHYLLMINMDALVQAGADDSLKNSLVLSPVHVWVESKTKTLRKIQFSLNGIATETQPVAGKADVALSFDGFNQPITVTAPTESKTFEEAMMSLFAPMITETGDISLGSLDENKVKEITANAIKQTFQSLQKALAGGTIGAANKVTGSCTTSGTGAIFATKQLQTLLTDTDMFPVKESVRCQSTGTAWALAATLPVGGNYCVDSSGFAGSVTKLSVVDDGNCK